MKYIEPADCKIVADRILKKPDQLYAMYRYILTKSQFNLLKGIASETSRKQPNASYFTLQHSMVAPSTVNRALTSLEESNLIAYGNED